MIIIVLDWQMTSKMNLQPLRANATNGLPLKFQKIGF